MPRTFDSIARRKILIESKPFALGVRIEHPQSLIDTIQYHCPTNQPRNEFLPPASYQFVDNSGGKVDFGDWTGGGRKEAIFEKALSKCTELFPNLTPNFFSKKASASSRSKKDSLAGDVNDPIPGNSTRKETLGSTIPATEASTGDEMVHMSYEVVVPAGLSPGQSFLTTINVGGTKKRFRLTVPDTNPSTLRFKTRIPKSLLLADAPAPKKPRTEGPGESAPGTTTGQGQDTAGQT